LSAVAERDRPELSVWVPRVVALVALLATAIAVVVAIASAGGGGGASTRDLRQALARVSARNQELSRQLAALAVGESTDAAQNAARQTIALVRDLQGQFPGDDTIAARAREVFTPELAYLDAVGSVLANPRSELRDDVVPRAQELRGTLQGAPASSPSDVKGYVHLVHYSQDRLKD
jgi:hypothetical protein